MRNSFFTLAFIAAIGLFAAGCAGPEQKFGRGLNNTFEVVRGGEFRRTIEQTAMFDSPEEGYTLGFIRGINRSAARVGIGLYEMITFPIPNHGGQVYDPICTNYLSPQPAYPDSFKPGLIEDSTFATDTAVGFGGGDVAPIIPGSRFRIFDNN